MSIGAAGADDANQQVSAVLDGFNHGLLPRPPSVYPFQSPSALFWLLSLLPRIPPKQTNTATNRNRPKASREKEREREGRIDSDRIGSDRIGSDRAGIGSESGHVGCGRIRPDVVGSGESERIKTIRIGSDRSMSYAVSTVLLLLFLFFLPSRRMVVYAPLTYGAAPLN